MLLPIRAEALSNQEVEQSVYHWPVQNKTI